jgi:hypothetical protein
VVRLRCGVGSLGFWRSAAASVIAQGCAVSRCADS